MATYAIGDIQGCYQSLQKLLNKIDFNPSKDRLWIVGDLINRGPESLKTLQYLYEFRDQVQCVLGNHDLHFLAVESGVRSATKKDTFDEILHAPERKKLVKWLKKQPLFYYNEQLNFAMAHAGVLPQWTIKQAQKLSKEVSDFVNSKKSEQFFAAMYGDTPHTWSTRLKGLPRLRFITNCFTRMRYCFSDGALDLTQKVPIGQHPAMLQPWFKLRKRPLGCQLVFGHWASLQGHCEAKDVYAIDTGCVWGGELTALRLDDQTLFSVASVEANGIS